MTREDADALLARFMEAWPGVVSFYVDGIGIDGNLTSAQLRVVADLWDASYGADTHAD